jgi:hypothetical protein
MSETAVYKIFDQIQHLAEEDRRLLDRLLADLEEQEWSREAAAARGVAERQGLDQSAIDRAVERLRYPA